VAQPANLPDSTNIINLGAVSFVVKSAFILASDAYGVQIKNGTVVDLTISEERNADYCVLHPRYESHDMRKFAVDRAFITTSIKTNGISDLPNERPVSVVTFTLGNDSTVSDLKCLWHVNSSVDSVTLGQLRAVLGPLISVQPPIPIPG
jgi:hypothetical protein